MWMCFVGGVSSSGLSGCECVFVRVYVCFHIFCCCRGVGSSSKFCYFGFLWCSFLYKNIGVTIYRNLCGSVVGLFCVFLFIMCNVCSVCLYSLYICFGAFSILFCFSCISDTQTEKTTHKNLSYKMSSS